MIRVAHILDRSAEWAGRAAVEQLSRRLSRHQFQQTLLLSRFLARSALYAIEPRTSVRADAAPSADSPTPGDSSFPQHPAGAAAGPTSGRPIRLDPATRVEIWDELPGPAWLTGPLAQTGRPALLAASVDLFHAFSLQAAQRFHAALLQSTIPLSLTLQSSNLSRQQLKFLRQLAVRPAVAIACATHRIQRLIVEAGVPLERTVVIRPAVDFAAIRAARDGGLRASLGLRGPCFLLVAPSPLSPGDLDAVWAAMVLALVERKIVVAVAENGPEEARLRRLASRSLRPDSVVYIGRETPFEDLVAAADGLLLGPGDRVNVAAIPWAMAAETLVIAAAGYDTAELIIHKVNGLLYKGNGLHGRVTELTRLLKERNAPDRPRWLAAARTQAYDVFGLKRFTDQTARLYHNLLENRQAADGIADAALVG